MTDYHDYYDYQCYTCGKVFSSEQAVESHCEAKQHSFWACDKCSDEFYNGDDLLVHTDEEHSHYCSVCDRLFGDAKALLQHIKSSRAHFYCDECQRSFVDQEALDQHLETSKTHKVSCPHCKEILSKTQHAQHFCTKHQFKCQQCHKSFESLALLQSHIQSTHRHPCTFCNTVSTNAEDLEAHMNVCHAFKCDYCTLSFRTAEVRQMHTALKHPLFCSRCTVTFKTDGELSGHIRDHHPLTYFKCSKCTKMFIDKQALDGHTKSLNCNSEAGSQTLSIRDGPAEGLMQKSKCPQCDQTFDGLHTFIEHYKWSHTSSSIQCHKCFRSCADQVELLQHNLSMHMTKCSQCDALFKDTTSLQRHLTMHESNTPPNSLTSKASTPSALTPQIICKAATTDASTETTKYRCEQCNDSFSTDEEWERHQDHSPFHKDKVLDCYECNLRFNTQIELLEHLDSMPHDAQWVLVLI